ncbi:histone-lysine N-methyltransferase 2A-like [Rhinoraja longicauda]
MYVQDLWRTWRQGLRCFRAAGAVFSLVAVAGGVVFLWFAIKQRQTQPQDRPVLLSKHDQALLCPLSPVANGNGGKQKGPSDGVHRIRVDFKEECSIENVWLMGGLSVLSSVPVLPRVLCLLCASQGHHELLHCQVCCEPFHTFCLDERERPGEEQRDTWCCRRCRYCHVCGRKSKSLKHLLDCMKCRATYHVACLGPNYPTKPNRRRQTWVCPKCVRCKSCGATTPGRSWDAEWSYDFTLCNDCTKLFEKGNYCPICTKCYEDNDYESKMMQCSKCDHWVHAKCEGVTDEMYEILSSLPDHILYTCLPCMEGSRAEWHTVVTSELHSGIQQVLTALLSSRLTTHLLQHRQVKRALKDVRGRIRDAKQRDLALKAFGLRVGRFRQGLQQEARRVGERVRVLGELRRKAHTHISPPHATSTAYGDASQRPAVLGDLQGACHRRFLFYKSLYDRPGISTASSRSKGTERNCLHQQWVTQVEGLLSNHPPNHILDSLRFLAQENTAGILQLLFTMNVTRDMEELRFCLTSSHLQDVSEPPPVLRSVDSLLQECWRDCELRAVLKLGAVKRQMAAQASLVTREREFGQLLQERYGQRPVLLQANRLILGTSLLRAD